MFTRKLYLKANWKRFHTSKLSKVLSRISKPFRYQRIIVDSEIVDAYMCHW